MLTFFRNFILGYGIGSLLVALYMLFTYEFNRAVDEGFIALFSFISVKIINLLLESEEQNADTQSTSQHTGE
jgi:hypothetical protein